MKVKVKVKASFSFYKLSRFINSKAYMDLKDKANFTPLVKRMKDFIKKGRVKKPLKPITINSRRKRKSPPSIGGVKPLFDTGKLVTSLKYDTKAKAIKGVHYALHHKNGFKHHLTGKIVPPRDFVTQSLANYGTKQFNKDASKEIVQLQQVLRRVFSRKLSK